MARATSQKVDALTLASVAATHSAALNAPLVTRFAPSPTGELHLGHVAHMVWLARIAEALRAEVVVRMEDHDRTRCRPEFEAAILDDWEWLGFATESASRASLREVSSPFRQSDNPARYQSAFDKLHARGLLYHCTCTRAMLGPPGPDGERVYPGTCRELGFREGVTGTVRVRLPDETVEFDDLLLGPQQQRPLADSGDPVIRDARGQWTYQLCVVADDIAHGISLIVRGEDLLSSTGRQWLLARELGRITPPIVAHHPLMVDANGEKLSKRVGSETVRAMRERGMTAGEVVGKAEMREER